MKQRKKKMLNTKMYLGIVSINYLNNYIQIIVRSVSQANVFCLGHSKVVQVESFVYYCWFLLHVKVLDKKLFFLSYCDQCYSTVSKLIGKLSCQQSTCILVRKSIVQKIDGQRNVLKLYLSTMGTKCSHIVPRIDHVPSTGLSTCITLVISDVLGLLLTANSSVSDFKTSTFLSFHFLLFVLFENFIYKYWIYIISSFSLFLQTLFISPFISLANSWPHFLLLLLIYLFIQLATYLFIYRYNPLNPFSVAYVQFIYIFSASCVQVFRVEHLALDNLLGSSSLEKANSPSLGSH